MKKRLSGDICIDLWTLRRLRKQGSRQRYFGYGRHRFQTEEPLELSGTGNIDLSEENKDSGGENADSSEENNGFGEDDTDIESTDTQEIDFTRDYSEDIKKDVDDVVAGSTSCRRNWKIFTRFPNSMRRLPKLLRRRGK